MTLAALIPAYCEERYLGAVVAAVRGEVDAVLVVDDGSPDGTAAAATAAGAEVLRQERNQGKGAALKVGFRQLWARDFDAVVMLDGDGQHLPEEIARFPRGPPRRIRPIGPVGGQSHDGPARHAARAPMDESLHVGIALARGRPAYSRFAVRLRASRGAEWRSC